MGVQKKLAVLFIALGVVFGTGIIGLQVWQERQSAEVLRAKTASFLEDSEQTFNNILTIKALSLSALSDSFAYWDEVVEFISSKDQSWAQNNLDSGLATFQANVMWVYDLDGKLVYYTDDRPNADYSKLAPPSEMVMRWEQALARPEAFLVSNDGPIQFIGYPVQNTEDPTRQSPAKGFLISGRVWDSAFISDLGKVTRTEITALRAGQLAAGSDYSLGLKDANGNPIYTLAVTSASARNDSGAATTSSRVILGATLAFCVMLFASLLAGVRFWVSRPLESIAARLDSEAQRVNDIAQQLLNQGTSLRSGTGEQSESITQTSQAVRQISTRSETTTDNSRSTTEAMKLLASSSEQGKAALSEMHKTINRIAKTSEEAASIIQTIDEIAFQTNLLALNAAVEAARAGDAGSGFAVVAEEVRNLAKRSADAARVTGEKLSKSREESANGLSASSTVTKLFVEVDDRVAQVSELVSTIMNASHEQTMGLAEISGAVQTIDRVTRSNLDVAESTADLSAELANSSEDLGELVANFNVLLHGDRP